MAIDARIPMQTTTIDPSQGLNALAGAFQFKARQKEREEDLAMRREDQEMRKKEFGLRVTEAEGNKEVRDLQIATAKFAQLDAREQRRLKSTILGAAQLGTFLDAGDTDGAANFLQTRRGQILQAQQIDPSFDTNETDQAIGMLQSGDVEGLKKITTNSIKLGQSLKILDKPQKEEGFTLGEGQKRYDSQGRLVASVAPASKILSAEELEQKLQIAAAGKPSVNVKVDAKMGESFAKEIGPMMTESRAGAQGALQAIDAAKRIRSSIDGGNVSIGPTATLRQNLNQFAQVLGATGATTEEKLVNTNNVMRGLAQLTVAARKQLKGQGQVSDYEGRLIQRAEAGEINDFTLPELRAFIGVTEQLASKVVAEHKRTLGVMRATPSLERFVPFYDVDDGSSSGSAAPEPTATNPQTGEKLILRNGKWQSQR